MSNVVYRLREITSKTFSKCPVNDDNDPAYKLCLAALKAAGAAVIRHIFDEKQQRKVLNALPN